MRFVKQLDCISVLDHGKHVSFEVLVRRAQRGGSVL
jgi:hypothetical protein